VLPTAVAGTSNEKAAQQIANNLKESGKLKGYRVGVKYEDGVAWLSGTVTSQQQLKLAEQIARNSAGVDHVICKLEVVAPEGNSFETPAAYQQQSKLSQRPSGTTRTAPRNNMPVPYAYTQGNVQAAAYQQAQYCPDGGYADGGMAPMGQGYALAELRGFAKLRCPVLSAAVFGIRLAIHWPVLSLPTSSAGMAESDPGMGRWLVVP
jgi:hypothetical protein